MKAAKLLPGLVIFALIFFTSCSTDPLGNELAPIENLEIPETKAIEIEIMQLINAHRSSHGLSILNDHGTVKAVAFTHTDYMIEVDHVSHDNFFQRKQTLQHSASANNVSENVAFGFTSAESVVNAWLNSESHRATIEGDYTDFDISAEQNNEGDWYFTNIFIKR